MNLQGNLRVKVFADTGTEALARAVNGWLEKNPAEVKSIEFSTAYNAYMSKVMFSAIVSYLATSRGGLDASASAKEKRVPAERNTYEIQKKVVDLVMELEQDVVVNSKLAAVLSESQHYFPKVSRKVEPISDEEFVQVGQLGDYAVVLNYTINWNDLRVFNTNGKELLDLREYANYII